MKIFQNGTLDLKKHYNFEQRIILSLVLMRIYILKKQGFIMMDFDFDYLKNLYIENPLEFERVTREMIEEVIQTLDEADQVILRAKQWRLEQELGKSKDPLERMNQMVALFWIQVAEFSNANKIFGIPAKKTKPCSTKSCTVLNFNKKE